LIRRATPRAGFFCRRKTRPRLHEKKKAEYGTTRRPSICAHFKRLTSIATPASLRVPVFPNSNADPIDQPPNGRTPKLPTSANLARKLLNLQAAPRTRSRLKIANFVNDFRTKK
jgi:transposase